MKKLVAALLLLNSLVFLHADILANGDFSDGKAHWKGDAKSTSDKDAYDMSTVDNPTAPNGIIVNLLKGTWAKVFQTFNTHEDSFNYSITFKTSADYAPVARSNGMGMGMPPGIPGAPGQRNEFLSTILGGDYSGNLNPPRGNDFLLLIIDMTSSTFSSAVIHTTGSTDQQTVTGVMNHVPAHDEKNIYLIFSPGKGSVTLLNVSLTPVESPSESVPFPGR